MATAAITALLPLVPAPHSMFGPAAESWCKGFLGARAMTATESHQAAFAEYLDLKLATKTKSYWDGWRAYLANEGGVYGRDSLDATVAEALA